MIPFPKERTVEIAADLEKMQFVDVERILSEMEELEDPSEPAVKACSFAEIPSSDTSMVDVFFVIRERTDGSLFIEAVVAWVEIATTRTENGFMDVQKTYLSSRGPLPTVDQMAKDIRDLVNYEEMVDFFLTKVDVNGHMWLIGFHNSSEILQSTRQATDIFYIDAVEKINGGDPGTEDSVHFQFVFLADNRSQTAKLLMIKAFLNSHSPQAADIRQATEKAFYPWNGQFVSKTAMVEEVLSNQNLAITG